MDGLLINLRLNNISNVITSPIALGEKKGVDNIIERGGGSRLSNLCPTYIDEIGSKRTHSINVSTLDRELPQLRHRSLLPQLKHKSLMIKVDTEGMELPILIGSQETLTSNNCYLMIEHHKLTSPELGNIDHQISEFLHGLGYSECWKDDDQQKFAFKNY